MMNLVVCDLFNKICMIPRCNNYPGNVNLVLKLQKLKSVFENYEIVFKQWESTDRTKLNAITLSVAEFIDLAATKINQ